MATKTTTDAGLEAAKAKLAELQAKQGELDREGNELNGAISAAASLPRKSALDTQAEALIGGKAIDHDTLDASRGRLARINEERRVIARAIELQRERVAEETARVSREACERLAPDYRGRVHDAGLALVALGLALERADAPLAGLRAEGLSSSAILRPMPVRGLGNPRDVDSPLAAWLREAIAYGFLAESDVPPAWRLSWGQWVGSDGKLRGRAKPAELRRPVMA